MRDGSASSMRRGAWGKSSSRGLRRPVFSAIYLVAESLRLSRFQRRFAPDSVPPAYFSVTFRLVFNPHFALAALA
jgi:hypothetical protein